MTARTKLVAVGQTISLEITGLNHSGEGVGRYEGLAVFVPGTVPGEAVLARVEDLKKNYARAGLLEVTDKSDLRREPLCAHYAACGGCRLQHIDYARQLRLKTTRVRDSLARIAGLDHVPVLDTAGMEQPWHYRNKVHYQLKSGSDGLELGFYREGSHTLAPLFGPPNLKVPGCLLAHRDLNDLAQVVEKILNRHGLAQSRLDGGRFFRHLMLRKGFATGETMAVLVTGEAEWPGEKGFVAELNSLRPGLTSLVRNINPGPPGQVLGRENRLLAGREQITDRLGHLNFIISPTSFYQVNPAQTLTLYRKALDYAGLEELDSPVVLDAYSGIGAIALFMAGRAGKVHGLEEVAGAVEDARRNAALNGIKNIDFHHGRVEELLPEMASRGLKPDVVVLDPPRSGCRPGVLEAVARMKTPRVVYISCDPGTLARDLGLLASLGYRTEEVQPVDMFPWTHHTETACLLIRTR